MILEPTLHDRRIRIGNLIYIRRKHLRLTQAELAKRAGTQQTKISRYELGRINPSTVTIQNIAAALKCKVSSLID